MRDFDETGEELDDDWNDDEDFGEEEDDEPTIDCPYCRAEIHEDAPRCPACGQYLSAEDAPSQRRPAPQSAASRP